MIKNIEKSENYSSEITTEMYNFYKIMHEEQENKLIDLRNRILSLLSSKGERRAELCGLIGELESAAIFKGVYLASESHYRTELQFLDS